MHLDNDEWSLSISLLFQESVFRGVDSIRIEYRKKSPQIHSADPLHRSARFFDCYNLLIHTIPFS